jgi:two-component sensor histidine kinase
VSTLNQDGEAPGRGPGRFSLVNFSFANRSTGFRVFMILSLALLPLGLIAFFATLQSSRTADLERRAQMRIALTENARQLASSWASDTSLTRVTMRAALTYPNDTDRCTRFGEILAAQSGRMPQFALFGAMSAPWCASPGFTPARPSTLALDPASPPDYALGTDALDILVPGPDSSAVGVLRYADRNMAAAVASGTSPVPYALSLVGEETVLPLTELATPTGIAGYETMTAPIGTTGLSAEITMARTPFSPVEILSILLPLVMWAAAALIGWVVVNRMLIRPLRRLQRAVSSYTPGEIVEPLSGMETSAQELRQLGETFRMITERISTHEAELAAGLARQTRLTREVHHRVKNNLQVVASLINLHARGQTQTDVVRAYSSIQRRVDALAVVHRNHYAELEENRGVSMRSLVGELAQNIRGSVREGDPVPPIGVDICPCYANQDVAVPVAFLLTELIELSLLTDPRAAISIRLVASSAHHARLTVASTALVETPDLILRMENRFGRVLEGLSRQLRSPLERNTANGQFAIEIAIVAETIDQLD